MADAFDGDRLVPIGARNMAASNRSPPRVFGSESENARKNGFPQCFNIGCFSITVQSALAADPALRLGSVVDAVASERVEGHGDAVHAVPQACRLRSVVEHVAEVASALAADNFGTHHAQAGVWAL
jgi:hypothetical protein